MPSYKLENELKEQGYRAICGVDEVGRGAWAGPVVVGAVILRTDKATYKLRDSKLLTEKLRAYLYRHTLENSIDYAVGAATNEEVDRLGLSMALKLAGKRCLSNLKIMPEIILLDGKWNYFEEHCEVRTIIKGDLKVPSISAASIVAKVTRDRLLRYIHRTMPDYCFNQNKGYGTKRHQNAIRKHGLTSFHRKSYNLDFIWTKKKQEE